jgi:hypothetical protein
MSPPVWVILPTYDEAGNLERIVRAVRAALPGAPVLVVDDSSPDGTGAIADALAAESDDVEALHRPRKSGLGRAYVAGCPRRVLGVGIRDLTGGFKAFRASALQRGLTVVEEPIVFSDREHGTSKMSARSVLEAAWPVPALRLGRWADSGEPADLPIT